MATVSPKNLAKAIYVSAKDKSGGELEHALRNAKDFLIKKNLLSKSAEILENLQKLVDDDSDTVRAKVISAEKLSEHKLEGIKHSLKKRYKAEHVLLEVEEDKTLHGGVRVETRDEVIDLSVKNKLNQLRQHLLAT